MQRFIKYICKKENWQHLLDRGLEYSLYALIFILPLSKAGIEIFFGISFFLFLAKKVLKPDFSFVKSASLVFLFLFLLFNCLSFINSGVYLPKSIKALFLKWLEYIIMFMMVFDTFSQPLRVRNAIMSFLVSSVVVGIDGLSQYFTGFEFTNHRELVWISQGFYAMTASFSHYNDLGSYLAPVLILIMALSVSIKITKGERAFLFFLMFILAASLFFSFSRNAWLGFMTGVAVTLLLPRRFGIFFIFISIFITVISILPNTRERALYVFKTYGTSERFLLWKTAWRMIAENPILGKGLGTFMDYCSKYTSGAIIRYAHNNYLQIWAETGIGSLLSFLSFVASILYLGIKRFRQTQDILLLGLMGALVGFLVESFFDTQFYSLQLASLFWLLVGIYMAQVNLLVSKSANL